jgi:CHASE2 domain-containing sensor protein/serine/threonine protein kinase
MAEESTSTLTNKKLKSANRTSNRLTRATSTASAHLSKIMGRLGHSLAGASCVFAALLAASGSNLPKLMEFQAHTAFFRIRGQVSEIPKEIVILAIDDQSISVPEQYYKTDPLEVPHLEPLQNFPYKREAYAKVIDKLMAAGARAVALDIVFDTPSSYGPSDDRKLLASLRRHGDKVALAALYENSQTHQGDFLQLRQPEEMFRQRPIAIGTANFPLEIDGKIHRLGSAFTSSLPKDDDLRTKVPDFAQATLSAAGVNFPKPKGDRIYYYGSNGSFDSIPFWHVFDPQNWNTYLQGGKYFKDKIVVIGATAKLPNDYHPVPISPSALESEEMSGVEIQANAIATLMEGRTLVQVIPNPLLQGLFVLALVGGCTFIVYKIKGGVTRFFTSLALGGVWTSVSYFSFVHSSLIFPTAIPLVGICAVGISYLGTEVAKEMIRKTQMVKVFQKYANDRVVQEILSQQDDLKDLLEQRQMAISGKIIDARYKIAKVLGSGGFSETYVAEDTKRPGNPLCVVKQLKPANSKLEALEIARRLFNLEAQILEKLGMHGQIPQLLAYFEEDEEFYLIQEYILGHPLSQELSTGKRLPESIVIKILRDLLRTLVFVHDHGVIHRDIKPSNIIRRHSDQKLVLIDFGAVKQVTTQIMENADQSAFTIGIGTRGYAPPEQCIGRPQYSSDIYAVGMIGIKALTGIAPHEIERDASSELKWTHKANVSPMLAEILTKMVLDDWKYRYQSASQALAALEDLDNSRKEDPSSTQPTTSINNDFQEDSDTPTTPWSIVSEMDTSNSGNSFNTVFNKGLG